MEGLQVLSEYLVVLCDITWLLTVRVIENQLSTMTPYHLAVALCVAPLGGFIFRIRGGYLAPYIEQIIPAYGATKSRFLASLLFAIAATIFAADPILFIATIPIYAGFPVGWFHAADLGRDGDRPWIAEFVLMTIRGILLTLVGGVTLLLLGYGGAYLACGMWLGVMYELGHRTPVDIPSFRRGMELGEFFMGCWLMSNLYLASVAYDPQFRHLGYEMWSIAKHVVLLHN